MTQIAIVGGPKTGKTTLAKTFGFPTKHTDDLMYLQDWSGESARAASWFDEPGSWVVEGVVVARALRKWLANNATGKPVDRVYVLSTPRTFLTAAQKKMAKGINTVMQEIIPTLRQRGVEVHDQ